MSLRSWTPVLPCQDLPEQTMRAVEMGSLAVLLVRRQGKVYAYEDRCTHIDFPLSTGMLDGGEIVCPWHGACFQVETGAVLAPPAESPLAAIPVREHNGWIELSAS